MGIRDVFNSVNRGVGKVNDSLSNVFGQTVHVVNTPVTKKVDPTLIAPALHHLESSSGTDPNTPRNQTRLAVIPAANANEKTRKVNYNIGYGGEYGLTPVALANLAKSQINKNAPANQYTQHGAPLIPGVNFQEIQKQLLTREGAGALAQQVFVKNRVNPNDLSPEGLANDYINYYVGKGTPGDTPQNRKRVLDYFLSIAR